MFLYYIRHGKPTYDPDCLTEVGHIQAQALSKRFYKYGLDKIYSSDSNRAVQTAEPTAKALNLEIEKLHWCNEGIVADEFNPLKASGGWAWAFGHEPTVKLFNSPEVISLGDKWYDYKDFKNLDFKKGVLRVDKEADAFLSNLGFTHDRLNRVYRKNGNEKYKRVALFAHQGFGMTFLSSILDIPYPTFCTHFELGMSSMTIIEFKERGDVVIPVVISMSNDSHLYKEGLEIYGPNNYGY